MAENRGSQNILEVKRSDQFRTVEELFAHSQANSSYYTLLIISVFVVASGLLINNSAIVIGGMLVTPVLTPILVIALGVAVGQPAVIKSATELLAKSFLIIVAVSAVLAFLFGKPQEILIFENTVRVGLVYFIVAVASGAAGAFAWSHKEISEILPGIAIAVSLVPPLSLVGIWFSALQWETARFYLLVSLFNLFGVLAGGLVVFSLLKFYKLENKIQKQAKESSGQKN